MEMERIITPFLNPQAFSTMHRNDVTSASEHDHITLELCLLQFVSIMNLGW